MSKALSRAFSQKKDQRVLDDIETAHAIDRRFWWDFMSTSVYRNWENTPSGAEFLNDNWPCDQVHNNYYGNLLKDPYFCEWG